MKSFVEINKTIREIKAKGETIYSNHYFNLTNPELRYETLEGNNSIVYVVPNVTRNNVIFYTSDITECIELLKQLPQDYVVSIISNNEDAEFEYLKDAGFTLYSVQQKIGEKLLPLEEQKIKMSGYRYDRFYDERFGAFASVDDLYEVQNILLHGFDPYDDDFFTDEELLKLIENENVLIDKQNGEIKTVHVFHIQGKRFFSNLIYNSGWAGALYTLEKKALLHAIDKYGVTYRYGWIRLTNDMAWKRNLMPKENVFNYTFRREK